MNQDNNVKIDITAEIAGINAGLANVDARLDQLVRSFDKHNAAAKQASRHLDDVERSANATVKVMQNLALKVAGVFLGWKAGELLKETALLAARLETLDVVLGTVGNNAGYTRAEMDAFTREVESMGITMLEARQTVISMAQAQMDLASAGKLARIAQDAAVIGNINSSEALGRMIYGIKSAQVEVLRNIGINVNFENSYKQLADQLHKNADALTEAEKAQARTNAVMEAGKRISGTYEAAMGTAGKQLNSLARYHENLKVVMGGTFTEALAAAVGAYTGELKDLNAAALDLKVQGDLKEWGRGISVALAAIGDAARLTYNTLGSVVTVLERLTVTAAILANPLASGVPRLRALQDDLKKQQEAFALGMADDHKLVNAVTKMFDDIDAKAKASADKRLAIEKDYVAKAQAVAAAYSGTQYQVPALLALADSYGGDIAAGHGSRPAADAGAGTPGKKKKDPNVTAVAGIQMDAFKAQMASMGVAAEQVKVYELAMNGASEAQIRAAQEAANTKIEIDAQTKAVKDHEKAVEQANKIIGDIDPIARASQEWEKLVKLHEQGLLTDEQMAQSYVKVIKQTDQTVKAMDDTWKRFTENVQRNLGDVLYNGMNGKFDGIADMFKQMLFRMAADAAAANITKALFGDSKDGGGGWIGSLLSFEGGGYTGSGARTGGVDGRGGFPVIIHPNESVIDHTRGGQAQGGVSQVVYNDYSVTNIDSSADRAAILSDISRQQDQREERFLDRMRRDGVIA